MKITLAAITISSLLCAEAHSQIMPQPCAIVCPIDAVLNKEKCTCETSRPAKPCALVCLGPDQVLDAKQCRCVNAGARGGNPDPQKK
jgi:hypothetical protein